jgi:hypothetical protein
MKPLLALLAFAFCLIVCARADVAEVKKLLDQPVVLAFQYQSKPVSDPVRDDARVAKAMGVPAKYGKFTLSHRKLFMALSQTQGRTSEESKMLAEIAMRNDSALRTSLLPAFKDAGLTSAASDLDEALKSVASSKTLDRAAQDRFARLARVAM